jgi:hypothetical protein
MTTFLKRRTKMKQKLVLSLEDEGGPRNRKNR